MVKLLGLISIAVGLAGVGVYYVLFCGSPPPLPEFDLDYWWGDEVTKSKRDTSIRPFRVHFSEAVIKDLKGRLSNRRKFTPPLEDVGFQYGFNSVYLEKVLDYWQNKYDFLKRQEYLNQFPQFKTNIQGLDIHFLHVKPGTDVPKGTKIVPLLLMHGWPGSVREFYEAIPLLTKASKEKGFAFELVIPSLPGYGFSSAAVRPGLGAAEMAVVMRNLMHRLGHRQFYVQGGDWGSIIGSHLATIFPKEVLGYHTNMPAAMTTRGNILTLLGAIYPPIVVESELAYRMYPLSTFYSFIIEETGYMHLQATKPDTVGTGLNDSPSGLAAYILEKFITWTNPTFKQLSDGALTKKFTLDQLIDNLMLYWVTDSITTSMRLYAETVNAKHFGYKLDDIPTEVPTSVLQTRYDLGFTPTKILKHKYPNLVRSTFLDDGGHFFALELPQVFADDVVKSVLAIEDYQKGLK